MVRAYATLYSEVLTSAGMPLATVSIVAIGNIKYLMPVNWTSYTASRGIHEQTLCMWKRMQAQRRGGKKTQNPIKQNPIKKRAEGYLLQQTRNMSRRNLKCHEA